MCSLFKDPRTKDAVIVATIVKKSQLIHLGRPLDSKDKPIPYNMYIELQDDSGHPPVVAVLWHNAAKKHFAALNLGDVISLTGFKKVIRATRYVTDWFCPGAEVELSVNSRNPTAVIKILRPVEIRKTLPAENFCSRKPMGCFVRRLESVGRSFKGGRSNSSVTSRCGSLLLSCFLLTCALF